MNSNEIVRMVVKLTGLAIFISGLIQSASYIPLFIDRLVHSDIDLPVVSTAIATIIPLFIGLFLWLFPAPITNTVIKDDLKEISHNDFLQGLEKIGIRLLGLFLLFYGLSDLVWNILSYRQAVEAISANFNIYGKGNYTATFIVTGIEIIMSIILIVGSNTISNFIRKIRYASS